MKTVRANKLTNSINLLLNEDKFSKYTLTQIYDELGNDAFLDYLEQLCYKAVKSLNVKYLKNMEVYHRNIVSNNSLFLVFNQKNEFWYEFLRLQYYLFGINEGILVIRGEVRSLADDIGDGSNSSPIMPDETDVSSRLKVCIHNECVKSRRLSSERKYLKEKAIQ